MKQLRVGYVRQYWPPYTKACAYTSEWKTCDRPGISMEIWRELANELGYKIQFVKGDDYGNLEDGKWSGLIGQLLNLTIDATTEIWITAERNLVTKYTYPVAPSEFAFIAGKLVNADSASNINVGVFNSFTLLAIIITTVILGIVHSIASGSLSDGMWTGLNIGLLRNESVRRLPYTLIYFGFEVIILSYYAGFRGQALGKAVAPVLSVAMVQKMLRSGEVRMLIQDEKTLKPYMSKLVYGVEDPFHDYDYPPIIEPNNARIMEMLCKQIDVIFYGDVLSLFSGDQSKEARCNYFRVQVKAEAIGFKGYFAFALRPDYPDEEVRNINEVISRLFNLDRMERFWMNRYASTAPTDGAERSGPKPIRLKEIWQGFSFYLLGMVISMVGFAYENRVELRKWKTKVFGKKVEKWKEYEQQRLANDKNPLYLPTFYTNATIAKVGRFFLPPLEFNSSPQRF